MPSAIKNGTVIGPVVTPPESKATAKNSFGTKIDSTNTSTYSPIRVGVSGRLNRVRSIDTTKNSPTPAATDKIITISGTAGTCRASTCRSGSAMVTTAPIKKQIAATPASFQPPPSLRPIWSPMGIMAMSAPSEKKPIPTISMPAPSKNSTIVPLGMGASVKLSASTITVMGSTEESASDIFSLSFFFNKCTSLSVLRLVRAAGTRCEHPVRPCCLLSLPSVFKMRPPGPVSRGRGPRCASSLY